MENELNLLHVRETKWGVLTNELGVVERGHANYTIGLAWCRLLGKGQMSD